MMITRHFHRVGLIVDVMLMIDGVEDGVDHGDDELR